METTRLLTQFQKTCEGRLCAALASRGLTLTGRMLEGEAETYIRALVRDTDIEVYIYEDGAQFHRGGKLAGLYERPDFDDANALQTAFVEGVLQAVPKR